MDDAPQTEHATGLAGLIAPVGRRVLGRHARLMRASGLRLGEAVAARHEPPEAAKAARRLAPVRLVTRTPAAPAPAAPTPAPAPAPETAGTESTVMPGMSDWAAEYLFGDADSAVSTGQAWMGGAGLAPRTPEERRLSRIKRGGPEVARAAKILEGDETPPATTAPKRLARHPAPESGVASGRIPTTDNPAAASEPAGAETAAPPAAESTVSETAPPTVARAVRETPAPPPSEPAGAETVARAARETSAPPPAEPTGAESVARAARETSAPNPSEPARAETIARTDRETSAPPPSEPAAAETVARTDRETSAPPHPVPAGAGAIARAARETPAEAAAGEPVRPTVARAAHETPADSPAGVTTRPTVARATRDTPASPPSETRGAETVARAADATAATPPSEPAAGGSARPTVARAARKAPSQPGAETSSPATGGTTRPTVARAAREASAGPATGGSSQPSVARVVGESAWPTVAREPATDARPQLARVRVSQPARPTVQRLTRSAPDIVPAEPAAPPAPTLLRRIADRLRPPITNDAAAPTPPRTQPRRAAVTRVVAAPAPPPAPPVSETPAIRGTNPERLARMLGTEVTIDEQGNPTVSMPSSTAPRTVSRAEDAPGADTAAPASTTPSLPVETGAETAAAVDVDAIADTVIDKLRRELLIEREQAGGPMDLI